MVTNESASVYTVPMFHGSLVLCVNWLVVHTINSQSNRFSMGVKIKATGELKLNDSPGQD